MSAWATLMPYVSDRRGYVRYGSGRNNYCDCVDCVARASRVKRREADGSVFITGRIGEAHAHNMESRIAILLNQLV
jgi:hypothetical protein